MAEQISPVGIVGAGPVGLACALRLASFGVRSVVLEAEPKLRKQGSKACLIQGDVLEILDKFGCAEDVAAEGLPWTVARTYVRGKEVLTRIYPKGLGYGPFVGISQYRVQQLMLEELEECPFTEVLWAHRVSDVEQDREGATVRVETPFRTRHLRFEYLVACDGARSDLRDLVGVDWTGYTHADRFLITDIRAALPLSPGRHFHYDPPFNPGRQLVMQAQPDDMWRIDWQLPPDADIDEEERTGALDRRIRAVIGDVPYELDWRSTYRFYQRLVERMCIGRVFFAGDAAHALPPYGARGMNVGIQDVDNLAWKLAYVIHGYADETLLDTYHEERHAAARENLSIADATIRFMVPPGRARRWRRNVLLRAAPHATLRRQLSRARRTNPLSHYASPDSLQVRVTPGSLAPDFAISISGASTRIRRLFGRRFVILFFAQEFAEAWRFVEEFSRWRLPVPTRIITVLPDSISPHGTPSSSMAHGSLMAIDEDPQRSAAYRTGQASWYVVRPDGRIAASIGSALAA
jgi:3-(3-hydroxy-phenyl)propionate hydroxylase